MDQKSRFSVQDLMEHPPPSVAETKKNWSYWSRKWTPEEKHIVSTLLTQVKPLLEDVGIKFEWTIQPVEQTGDAKWGDQAYDLYIEKYGEEAVEEPHILWDLVLWKDQEAFEHFLAPNRGIWMDHELGKHAQFVHKLFTHYFGTRFKWDGNDKNRLEIS